MAARPVNVPIGRRLDDDARRDEVRDLDVRMYVENPCAPEIIRDALLEVCDDDARR